MPLIRYTGPLYAVNAFCRVLFWKNMEKLRPDWGDTTRAAMAGLGSKGLTSQITKKIYVQLNLLQPPTPSYRLVDILYM